MKYKIRYMIVALILCGILGWALVYEAQKPPILNTSVTSSYDAGT